jgi:hypothetical protein
MLVMCARVTPKEYEQLPSSLDGLLIMISPDEAFLDKECHHMWKKWK